MINTRDNITIDEACRFTSEIISDTLKNASPIISDMTTHLSAAAGKGIRARVLLNAARDLNGLVPPDALKAAAAIEIFHLATLVHDDVIDDSPLRRGIMSVQSKFGKKQAVICGDYLFCLAISFMSEIYKPFSDTAPLFAKTLRRICFGELSQLRNNFNTDLSLSGYLNIISGKTAALFYMSAYGGAVIGGCNEKQAAASGRFGKSLGMIFQIVDDCKDYINKEANALKPVGNDLCSGVITIPLIMAFIKNPALKAGYGELDLSLINEVNRLDGCGLSLNIAKRYGAKAEKILCKIENPHIREEFLLILNKVLGAPL